MNFLYHVYIDIKKILKYRGSESLSFSFLFFSFSYSFSGPFELPSAVTKGGGSRRGLGGSEYTLAESVHDMSRVTKQIYS